MLANLTEEKGVHRLKDLLPLPFDARLLVSRSIAQASISSAFSF